MNDKDDIPDFKYIKLGRGGNTKENPTDFCIKHNILALGYNEVPIEISHDADQIKKSILEGYEKENNSNRKSHESTASNHARQVSDFHTADENTYWITFHDGRLYYCQAKKQVIKIANLPQAIEKNMTEHFSRYRETLDGWKTSHDDEFSIERLNGALTQTASYQGTICDIKPQLAKYTYYKIKGWKLPEIKEAEKNKENILSSIQILMKQLNPYDFELLVDLVFSKSGWQRISSLGGVQKDTDIVMRLPSTGEKAYIQIKSKTNQNELDRYIDILSKYASDDDKIFYIYHSSEKELKNNSRYKIYITDSTMLSEMILDAGLFNWLFKRVG